MLKRHFVWKFQLIFNFVFVSYRRKEGYIKLFLHWYQKFYNTELFLFNSISLNFENWLVGFCKLNVQTFQPLILIYRKGNFVHHHWGNLSAIVLSFQIPGCTIINVKICGSEYTPLAKCPDNILVCHHCFFLLQSVFM